jgi:3-methyladenine DNA glycosylase AlkD
MNVEEILIYLKELSKNAKPGYKEGMARFGIASESALGIPVPEIRKLAKEREKDHRIALQLWKQDIHEAKLLATMVDDPKLVTEKQMDEWVNDFYSWDICDQCCTNLFDKTPFYKQKIFEYVRSNKEFVRRTGFVLMATSAVHDKTATDDQFLSYLPIIEQYANDERNFVKKAVNWALRQIGKRNNKLHREAVKLAKKLKNTKLETGNRKHAAARWIGSDALRELENPAIVERIRKKKNQGIVSERLA